MKNITYTQPAFGIKNQDPSVSVYPIYSNTDLLEYDFLLSVKKTTSYNGNKTFYMDIQPLKEQKNIKIYGWEIIDLRFPGNWFGQWGVCKMQDRYGKETEIVCKNQLHFNKEPEWLLLKTIKEITQYAKNNPFVLFIEFLENIDAFLEVSFTSNFNSPVKCVGYSKLAPKNDEITFKGVEKWLNWLNEYINMYHNVLILLSEQKDERFDGFIEKLNNTFSDVMSKNTPFKKFDFSKEK